MFKRECLRKYFLLYKISLCLFKRECLPQHLPYGPVHPRYPRGRTSSSLSNPVLGRPSVSLSNPVLFCGLAIIIFIHNIGSRDVHDAEDSHEHEDREGYVAGHLHTLLLKSSMRNSQTCCLHACPKRTASKYVN